MGEPRRESEMGGPVGAVGKRFGWFLVALLLCAPPAAAQLLVAVVPNLPGTSEGDEALAIGSATNADVTGWQISDGEGAWTLPPLVLQAGQVAWFVGNRSVWEAHDGPAPVACWCDLDSGPFRLANDGDDLVLRDASGRVVDAMAYGDKTVAGQSGSVSRSAAGLVLQRDRLAGPACTASVASCAWMDRDDYRDWVTPREHQVGESGLDQPTFVVHDLTLYASPDSSFATLTDLVATARQRLHLHVYELRSPALVDRLVAAKQATPTLDLQVLVDGQPVGMSAQERHETAWALRRIQDVGGSAYLAGHDRYNFHHLKVLVVDDAVAVQSENWVPSGVPEDPTWGNRGWGVVVRDKDATDWFAAWMARDREAWDTTPFDLAAFDPTYTTPQRIHPRAGDHDGIPSRALRGNFTIRPLVAPDHTQDPRVDVLEGLVAQADRIDVQQLDLAMRATNRLGWSSEDPLTSALQSAAQRGATVRVQAAAPFAADDTGNAQALAHLAAAGARVQVFDVPGIQALHNKGLIADDAVVLGSLNGNHHSRSQNREVSIVLGGPGVADYYRSLFDADWAAAGQQTTGAGNGHGPANGNGAGSGDGKSPATGPSVAAAPLPTLLVALGVALVLRR